MKILAFLPLTLVLMLAILWSIISNIYTAIKDILLYSKLDILESWNSYKRVLKDL